MFTVSGLHFWWSVVCVVRTNFCVLASVDSPLRAGYLLGFDVQYLFLESNAAVREGLSRVCSVQQYSEWVEEVRLRRKGRKREWRIKGMKERKKERMRKKERKKVWMNERKKWGNNECTNEWKKEWKKESEWMIESINERKKSGMNEWMNERKKERKKERMTERKKVWMNE